MFGFLKKGKKKGSEQAVQLAELSGQQLAEEGLNKIASAIKAGAIKIQPGEIFNDIYAHGNKAAGVPRLSYVMFSPTVQNEFIARCTLVFDSKKDGVACW